MFGLPGPSGSSAFCLASAAAPQLRARLAAAAALSGVWFGSAAIWRQVSRLLNSCWSFCCGVNSGSDCGFGFDGSPFGFVRMS